MSTPLTRRASGTRRSAPLQDWAARGACASHPDPDLWFADPSDTTRHEQAIALCESCPVKAACLNYALALPNMPGTWGGTTETERALIRRRARRGSAA